MPFKPKSNNYSELTLVIGVGILITPWLEQKKRERLLYTDEPVTIPVANQYIEDSDTFSSNTNTNLDTPLKMTFTSNSSDISMEQPPSEDKKEDTYRAEPLSTSNDISQEEKPKSGLSLRLKDE